MLGTTVSIWTMEVPEFVFAPAVAGAVLIGAALSSRKEIHAFRRRMSGESPRSIPKLEYVHTLRSLALFESSPSESRLRVGF